MRNCKDITNERFGKLKVLKFIEKKGKYFYWLCDCDCGKQKVVKSTFLREGKTRSCGCIKKSNKFEIINDYVIGMTKKGELFYFDLEDLEKVKKYTWTKKPNGYFENRKSVGLQRYIMGANPKEYVDHENHDLSDNRKYNLRKCSCSNNMMNQRMKSSNKSGKTGVYWSTREKIWVASICIDYNTIVLGYFKDFDEAKFARIKGEEKYHKNFKYELEKDINFKMDFT